MRPHLSLDVRNVPASVQFYQKVFGVAPQKQTADYAKFDLITPALNFTLVASTGKISSVDHLGIEVESTEAVAVWKERLQEQGILEKKRSRQKPWQKSGRRRETRASRASRMGFYPDLLCSS